MNPPALSWVHVSCLLVRDLFVYGKYLILSPKLGFKFCLGLELVMELDVHQINSLVKTEPRLQPSCRLGTFYDGQAHDRFG